MIRGIELNDWLIHVGLHDGVDGGLAGQPALVVDADKIIEVCDEHVVGFVHGHDGADSGTGLCVTAEHAEMVASVGTLG